MSCNWPVVTLAEITSRIGDGLHGTPKYDDNGDYYFINGNNLSNGKIVINEKTKRTDESQYLKHKKDLNERTLLVSINGTLGNIGTYQGEKVFLGKSACYLNVLPSVNKDYVMYVLTSKHFQDYIHNLATGSTIKNVGLKLIREYEFQLPDTETQDEVANVLVSIDSKITVNQQINKNLEEMAQALFKSWFVDFDPVKAKMNGEQPEGMDVATASLFPEKLVESELGLIPEGWDINYIKDFGKVVTGKTPPKKVEDAYAEEGVPFVTPSDIDSDVFVSETKRFLSESGVEAVKKNLLPAGSICVTCIGSQMGKAVISPSEAISNQQINSVVVAKDYERNFLFLNLRRRREEIFLIGSSGSTMPIINKSTFEKLAVLTPSEELMHSFDRAVSSLLSKIHQNAIENQTLSSLRDTLLPKLLSGEIELDTQGEVA
ncbi:restriction modification system subunit S (plasmid) [Vibrio sp. qd031]|uniref:restriction endonuclease subunit S n=1 Tax=Vibrio sp. qd031 TaxID=1603038 RepID=UPI000A11A914|nr:restriction endonuclease subunit S [Vibrio sp. qd031]ORT52627.1 restriction modification system subunit S [Vibrio sp. qd031]